ncbi:MAG: YjbH domain-containing protein [Deltaproteobacteria bacterium]
MRRAVARNPVRPESRPTTEVARRALVALLALACLGVLPPRAARAGDAPFTFPSNSGLTGLLETPTARVMETNRYRVGAAIADPYRWYYGAIGIFPRVEAAGRITEVRGVPGFSEFGGYGDFKDKAFDLKVQFLREGKYAPALSLAILDPHGTRIYSSQAIVASKQIFPFDFTIGLGNGRLGKSPLPSTGEGIGLELFTDPREWWQDANLFGGIQFAPSERFALVAEYSPVAYHRQANDPARDVHFRDPVPSRFNFGLRWKPLRWAEVDLSWQRGNRIGVNLSVAFDIGRELLPIYDPPYREPAEARANPVEDRITQALAASGFRDIGVSFDGLLLRIEARNDRYFFPERAIGMILELLSSMEPERFEYIQIVLTEEGIPLLGFAATGHGLSGYDRGEIPGKRFPDISRFTLGLAETPPLPVRHRRRFDWTLRPSFETFLNDPSGFFKYRLGAAGEVRAMPWRGGTLLLGVEGYPLNTVSTVNVPLSIPVRSDLPLYKKEDAALGRLLAEQIVRAPGPAYGRIAAGYLEVMYAGVDAETAVPLIDGRILAGVGGSYVWKRDPGDPFRLLSDRRYHTLFLNGRLNLPEADLFLDVRGGRFLAGDLGARFTLSKVVRGVTLSAWYSVTDTSDFTDPFNRGYHDKGIAVEIPIRLFLGRDSRTAYRFSLSPWTRDAGQDLDRHRSLFDFLGRNLPVWMPGPS